MALNVSADQHKFELEQHQRVKVGDRVPLDFNFLVLDNAEAGMQYKIDPRSVRIGDLVRGKRAVLFGLPGAYTSVCSSKHVPQYSERLDALKAKGVEFVGCVSVNDPWVMREWANQMGIDTSKIVMLADGDGVWHAKLGLLQHIPGLGVRALRYSMLLQDGEVRVLNVEEPGGKSYKVSGPDHMLEDIARLDAPAGTEEPLPSGATEQGKVAGTGPQGQGSEKGGLMSAVNQAAKELVEDVKLAMS